MRSSIEALCDYISDILAATSETRTLTLSNYHLLKTIANNEILSNSERKSIQRTLYLLRRGRISLIDDLSEGLMSVA